MPPDLQGAPQGFRLTRLTPDEIRAHADALADVLVDCVEGGASVNFMAGFTRERGRDFWLKTADHAESDHRALFIAMRESNGEIVGTVQMIPVGIENQPHRGEVAKMLVKRTARRCGLGAALMCAAENAALEAGRTLLILDTASDDAERLYAALGWIEAGRIPDYALMPDGAPCASIFFYRKLAPTPAWTS
jgi:GNAT superfamily N-acetyltransferase